MYFSTLLVDQSSHAINSSFIMIKSNVILFCWFSLIHITFANRLGCVYESTEDVCEVTGYLSITHRHRRKGSVLSRLLKLIRSHSSQQNSSVGDSALSCTAIFNDQARHFNLQLPQVSSSSVLLYYQATKNGSRLNTRKKNWNGLVEVFLGDLKLCFQNVVTVMRRQIHNKPCARRRVNR